MLEQRSMHSLQIYTFGPAVEVHLSDVDAREAFRHVSYAGMACFARFTGLGFEGYRQAVLALKDRLNAS